MSAATDIDVCPICGIALQDGSDVIDIRKKGADGINAASVRRGDNIVVTTGCKAHSNCRKSYVNSRAIDQYLNKKRDGDECSTFRRSIRISEGPFNSQADCLFCGTSVRTASADFSCVKTDNFAKTVIDACDKRSDDWSFTVRGRVEYYNADLHAADCVYHATCSKNFRSGLDVPQQFKTDPEAKRRKLGRPKDEDQEQAFSKVCEYLEENDEEQLTISDLRCKIKDYLLNVESTPYGNQYLKGRLKDRYGDGVCISEGNGVDDIVTLREQTSHILREYFKNKHQEGDEEAQKIAIIETAARLLRSDIKTAVPTVSDEYPRMESVKLQEALAYIPDSLKMLLKQMIIGKDTQEKIASLGQAIIQAVRPRSVIAPLQICLGVQMHYLYRSRFLVDTLHELGYCSSYSEVQRFQRNAANCVAPNILGTNIDVENTVVLFAADNVDHNILTIDGKGTFHGMGMIAAVTPGQVSSQVIRREKVTGLKMANKCKIDIIECRFARHVRQEVKFASLPSFPDYDNGIDLLWQMSFNFKQTTPGWHGMMHTIRKSDDHPGQSSVKFLPMIDMYSGDKNCILSTMEFLCVLASKHHFHPILTFDQPLYWKAAEIIRDSPSESELRRVVLMLGCFHTFMNLLGAIGTLMEGTGLKAILETVYGENAVVHMCTGKSVQRAFRGHLLVDKCLNRMIFTDMTNDSVEVQELIGQSEDLYTALLHGDMTLEAVVTSDTIRDISSELQKRKTEMALRSKTSKLWLSYQSMVKVARSLIMADRTGSWLDHLRAVSDCIPIFAAAGHFNYLKSAYYYVQEMGQLSDSNPDVFQKFKMGFHVVRRSNHFWAGLSPDLVIEQTLMRSLKSTGGLTRGSGMSDEQRALWTLSSPILAGYNTAMQDFTSLIFTNSEQHKDMSDARQKRDLSDLEKISTKLSGFSPFSPDPSLRNIVNGIVANDDVNVHEYEFVADKIVSKMVGEAVFALKLSRKGKVRTLGECSAVKVAADRTIDPALLFQRFLVVSKTAELCLNDVMSFELSPYPPALFESVNVFRKADKPQLARAICEHSEQALLNIAPQTECTVLDGGSLLHRVMWKCGETFSAIAKSYADFVLRHYGSATTIVFDGYEDGPSIKDNTHQRRGYNIHPVVNFTAETEFSGKKDNFLSRDVNKQRLIQLISDELRNRDCTVVQAAGDADLDIVQAAVELSMLRTTTVIAEDTDLLVLLLYYAERESKALYFRSDKTKADGITTVYDINRVKEILGYDLCSQLLFIHAMTGCDTTSRIFGISKKNVFQKFRNGSTVLETCSEAFRTANQVTEVIDDLGCQAMTVIFGGKSTDALATMRYNFFTKKVVSASSFVTPERLPPTESATKFHCRRVYYQIMAWLGKKDGIEAIKWGWRMHENRLVPVMSEANAAPESLLKIIHCNCSSNCKTGRCSCRKYGLPCTAACGSCQVENCENPNNKFSSVESDDEEEI